MSSIGLADLYRLGITPTLRNESQLHIVGPEDVLNPNLLERIRLSKLDLIQEIVLKCEHVNVVNVFSENNLFQRMQTPILRNFELPVTISATTPTDPLQDLDITFSNRAWINKQLEFMPKQQRRNFLEEYRRQYLQASHAIPERLSHRKSNAGTFASNTWLRKTLCKTNFS